MTEASGARTLPRTCFTSPLAMTRLRMLPASVCRHKRLQKGLSVIAIFVFPVVPSPQLCAGTVEVPADPPFESVLEVLHLGRVRCDAEQLVDAVS